MFTQPVDIANLACQSLGVARMAAFSDNSKQAIELNALYDKIRVAELRSRVWRYATRKAALRALTSTSVLLNVTALTWAVGTTYQLGDIVFDPTANTGNGSGAAYISLLVSNTGNTPNTSPTWWAPYFGPVTGDTYSTTVSYYAGELAVSSTHLYLSTASANLNVSPGTGPWTLAKIAGSDGNIPTLFIPYPVGYFTSGATRSYFRLPWGYQRVAPQDPKIAGGTSQITAAGMQYSDWQFEGNLLLTAAATPIIFRFVADITNVADMDTLFCRAFASRLAYEACETITGSDDKKQSLAQDYDRFIAQARSVNSIEQGSTDPIEEEIMLSRLPAMSAPPPQARGRG